jgi:hypothetical protein
MIEISEQDGLRVELDEESSTFSFVWDDETHPEWNFLKNMTNADFAQMMQNYIDYCDANQEKADLQSGGSCCGTSESCNDSGIEG